MGKRKSLRDVARELSQPQTIMKTEMLRPKLSAEAQRIKDKLEDGDYEAPNHTEFADSEVKSIGQVFDETFGVRDTAPQAGLTYAGQFDVDVPELARMVINEHDPHLSLSMNDWARVSALIEAGLRLGFSRGAL